MSKYKQKPVLNNIVHGSVGVLADTYGTCATAHQGPNSGAPRAPWPQGPNVTLPLKKSQADPNQYQATHEPKTRFTSTTNPIDGQIAKHGTHSL